jgi:hypothetical protein
MRYYKGKVCRAEREVECWRTFLTPDVMSDRTNYVFKEFQSSIEKFHQAEKEVDDFAKGLGDSSGPDHYQAFMDEALMTLKLPGRSSNPTLLCRGPTLLCPLF